LRLASLMLGHPDEERFIEWSDFQAIKKRADRFLGSSHRFAILSQQPWSDFKKIKTIRNAVGHQSEKAWRSFRSLWSEAPFSPGSRFSSFRRQSRKNHRVLSVVSKSGLPNSRVTSRHGVLRLRPDIPTRTTATEKLQGMSQLCEPMFPGNLAL
jgi:hypothetical protein